MSLPPYIISPQEINNKLLLIQVFPCSQIPTLLISSRKSTLITRAFESSLSAFFHISFHHTSCLPSMFSSARVARQMLTGSSSCWFAYFQVNITLAGNTNLCMVGKVPRIVGFSLASWPLVPSCQPLQLMNQSFACFDFHPTHQLPQNIRRRPSHSVLAPGLHPRSDATPGLVLRSGGRPRMFCTSLLVFVGYPIKHLSALNKK